MNFIEAQNSFLNVILPYYGNFDDWKTLLTSCCKASKVFWELNLQNYQNLENETGWRVDKNIILNSYYDSFEEHAIVDQSMELELNLCNQNTLQFINKWKEAYFPSYHKLIIDRLKSEHSLQTEIKNTLNQFLYPKV